MLENITIIELASVLAGPSVGQFFAELGANVIKIENPKQGGDVTRTWRLPSENPDSLSAYFCSANFGKKSLALDLTNPEGQKILHQLAQKADIVIASYKAGDAQKMKADYETLKKYNSRLIYGHITGYQNDRVGYDAIIQAEAGFMAMNGYPDSPPTKMPVALVDVLAAHQLKESLLLALLKRTQTGLGEYVRVSLFDSAVASLANQATNWLVAGHIPKRMGSAHPNIVPYGTCFETEDSKMILVAVGNDRQFADLCQILGNAEWAKDARFATNPKRVQNREILLEKLIKKFKNFTKTYLLEQFEKHQVPAGGINEMPEVFGQEEAKRIVLEDKDLNMKGLRNFVGVFENQNWKNLSPPPRLGEHNEEILKEFLG